MSRHDHAFTGNTAIAGIGATEFSKESGRSELRLAAEAVDLALRDAGIEPAEVDGLVTFSADTNPEIEIARSLGIGELTFFSRIHYGGGAACGTVQQAALAVAGRCGRRGGLLPGLQRALRQPVRDRGAGPRPGAQRRDGQLRLVRPHRPADPGPVGGHGRPALPARDRGHHRGPRTGGGGRPPARRHQPQGVVLREADHPGGPPGVAVDRRAAPPARLLPGDRRRPGPGGHLPGAGPRPARPRRWSSRRRPREPGRVRR